MFRTLSIAILLAAVTPLRAEQQTDPELIRFENVPKAGQTLRARITSQTVGSMKFLPAMPEQRIAQFFEEDIATTCIKVEPDNSSAWDLVFERMHLKMNVAGIEIEYQFPPAAGNGPGAATAPETNQGHAVISELLRALRQSKVRVSYDPNGRTVKVEGVNAVFKQAPNEKQRPLSGADRRFVTKFRESFTDEIMLEQMKGMDRMLPPNMSARVGEKWRREWEFAFPGIMNARIVSQAKYTLAGVQQVGGRKCAKIRFKQTFATAPKPEPDTKADPDAPREPASRLDVEMQSSTGDGVALWDYKTGLLVRERQTARMTVKMTVRPNPDGESEMDRRGYGPIVYTMNQSIRFELLDGEGESGKGGK